MRTITSLLARLACLVPLFYSTVQAQNYSIQTPQPIQMPETKSSPKQAEDSSVKQTPSANVENSNFFGDTETVQTVQKSNIETPNVTKPIEVTPPAPKIETKTKSNSSTAKKAFDAFTGRITKNKVRLRLQPSFDSQAIRELNRDNLIIILGETDDFYAVKPANDIKAYVFRTYILDNIVEGSRVNIRLKPDLEAPVIAQLNSGDRVEGHIYAPNNKWMEIALPASTRFYVAKEYVEKVGDADYIERMDKRRDEVYRLLNTTKAVATAELQKPFDQIKLDGIIANYQRIILDYKDFPDAGIEAQDSLRDLQDAYMKKRISHLEHLAKQPSNELEQKNKKLAEELEAHKNKLSQLEQQMQKEKTMQQVQEEIAPAKRTSTQLPQNMATWIPVETNLFEGWSQQTGNTDPSAFYQEQKEKAFVLRGVVDPYNRPVKNKPGDYMLLNASSKLPIAFIYSTHVNLQELVGHEVSLLVVPRPNFNYAFPAYFVLSIGE